MLKPNQIYLILAENVKISGRRASDYQSAQSYKGKLWGFSSPLPLPRWYPRAKEVLLRAIELDPKQDSFGLIFNGSSRTIDLYPVNLRDQIEMGKTIDRFIREKRATEKSQRRASVFIGSYAQSPPSGKNILEQTVRILKSTPNVPSRLLKHPYFSAKAEQRWPGVDSYLRPRKTGLKTA